MVAVVVLSACRTVGWVALAVVVAVVLSDCSVGGCGDG